jgi:hypothetical protein
VLKWAITVQKMEIAVLIKAYAERQAHGSHGAGQIISAAHLFPKTTRLLAILHTYQVAR